MKQGHTPGPWKILKGHSEWTWFVVFKSRKDERGNVRQRAEVAHVSKGHLRLVKNAKEEGLAVASLDALGIDYAKNKDSNMAETEANAKLISAAPELLAALKRLLDCTQGVEEDSLAAAQDEAMEAIEKAEGK